MHATIFDKQSKKLVGHLYFCHGCGDKSPVRKKLILPPRWVEKTELSYGDTGQRRKGMGWVVNAYCGTCHRHGCSAHTVAATVRKLTRTKPKTPEKT